MTAPAMLDVFQEWTMVIEWGVYVDGEWVEWLPPSRVDDHGWESPEAAVAYWRSPDRVHRFVPYGNGREKQIISLDSGPVFQRVTFEARA